MFSVLYFLGLKLCHLGIVVSLIGTAQLTEAQNDTEVTKPTKGIGIVETKGKKICQGVFLTLRDFGTSCRCMGSYDSTGNFQQGKPEDYQVVNWSSGVEEKRPAAKLHYHRFCGFERNKILLDLGIIQTSTPFGSGSVDPVDVPNLSFFRSQLYISNLSKFRALCLSSNMASAKGKMIQVQVLPWDQCSENRNAECDDVDQMIKEENCTTPTLHTNHICARGGRLDQPWKPADCSTSPGSPLICHGMLVGINAAEPGCPNITVNPALYARIDVAADWITEVICH